MYANTTNGHIPNVTGNKQSKVVMQLLVWGNVAGVIVQDEDVVTEEWNGLSYTDVQSLYESKEESTLNGYTRQYLGNAMLTQTGGIVNSWCRAPSCWGTKVTTSYNRIGDTNLYHVVKTTTTYSVRGFGGNTQLILE